MTRFYTPVGLTAAISTKGDGTPLVLSGSQIDVFDYPSLDAAREAFRFVETPPTSTLTTTSTQNNEVLIVPSGWNPAYAYRNPAAVIGIHGRSGTDETYVGPTAAGPILYALAGVGYPVISTDAGGLSTWGNDVALGAIDASVKHAQGQMGASPFGVHLVATSMGGLAALNYARAHVSNVRSLTLLIPIVDLSYGHDADIQGWGLEIEGSYGGLGGYLAARYTHDPSLNIYAHQTGPSIKMFTSSDDPVGVIARQTAFATAVGSKVSQVNIGAVGHSYSAYVNPQDVVDFVTQH